MAEKHEIKVYDKEEMVEFCKKHMEEYMVEPIIREAFQQGLISPVRAFVYLRLTQMISGKEDINCSQIAKEIGKSNSTVTKYKQNPLIGITQKVFIQLLIKNHLRDWMNICESNKPNEALAEYVNKYRRMIIYYGKEESLNKADYVLDRNNDVSKDVCRKAYDELVNSRLRDWETINYKMDAVIKTEVINNSEEVKVRITTINDEDESVRIVVCSKQTMVHELVKKLGNIIGGLLSGSDTCKCVYLISDSNRKVNLAMEYIALNNERVFLL